MSGVNSQKARVDVDEDVDDLDDVLDQFSTEAPKPTAAPPLTSKSTIPPSSSAVAPAGSDDFSDDFARELARGMESLMRDMGAPLGNAGEVPGSAASVDPAEEQRREEAFRKAWEAMLIEGMDGAVPGLDDIAGVTAKSGSGASTGAEADTGKDKEKATGAAEDDFQKNIRAAMQKLKESEQNLRDSQAASTNDDDLEKLLAEFGEGKTEDELNGLLDGMMSHLMSKDILYEPLKELSDKFPPYLEENKATLSELQYKQYTAQHASIAKMIAIFDDPSYSDSDSSQNAAVVSLMTEMQSYGSPPVEIMGELPPGLDLGADGLPQLPEGCIIT